MELRKLYRQGKSLVLVIPSKYLKILGWSENEHINLALLPDKTLRLSKLINTQPSIFYTQLSTNQPNGDNNDTN